MLDGLHELDPDRNGVVCQGRAWEDAVLREEVKGATDAIVSCLWDKSLHALILVEGGARVPGVDSPYVP